jgi:glycerol kinase
LSPVLSWQDRRAAAALEALQPAAARVEQLSGLRLSPHYGASKLRWLWEHESRVAEAARDSSLCLGPLAGYLAGTLGAPAEELVDAVSASRTQLVELATREWSEELCALFRLRREWLPRIAGAQSDFGRLCVGRASLPLRVVTGDQSAAVFAAGEPAPRTLLINLGTGGFVQALVREPRHAAGLLTSLLPSDERGPRFSLEGTINGAGSALEWCAERHGLRFDPDRLEAALHPDRTPPLFFNAHSGLAAPFWRPHAVSRFSNHAGALEELAAVAESILFLVLAIADRMRAVLGSFERAEISGGLARSDALCQRLADLLGIEVWRREETEASARGLAWLCLGTPMEAPASRCFDPREQDTLLQRQARWNTWIQELLCEST